MTSMSIHYLESRLSPGAVVGYLPNAHPEDSETDPVDFPRDVTKLGMTPILRSS